MPCYPKGEGQERGVENMVHHIGKPNIYIWYYREISLLYNMNGIMTV